MIPGPKSLNSAARAQLYPFTLQLMHAASAQGPAGGAGAPGSQAAAGKDAAGPAAGGASAASAMPSQCPSPAKGGNPAAKKGGMGSGKSGAGRGKGGGVKGKGGGSGAGQRNIMSFFGKK